MNGVERMAGALRRVGLGRSTPTLAAGLFLGSSAILCLVALLIPDYVRSGPLHIVFACVVAYLGLNAVVVLLLTRLPEWLVLLAILVIDVLIVVGFACLQDRASGRISAALFALPTLYLALYAAYWTMLPQVVAVVSGSLVIMLLGGHADRYAFIGALTVLLSVFSPVVAVLVLRDRLITAVRRAKALSTTDPLTGLLNRRGIAERAPSVVRAARENGLCLGVVVADVDHFKRINDRYGHAAGDEVLRLIARATQSCVNEQDLVVRLGGEELAVLTALEPAALVDLAERIRYQVSVVTAPRVVTVSVGVAWVDAAELAGDPVLHTWTLMDEADDLMYSAKRAGRNRVSLPTLS